MRPTSERGPRRWRAAGLLVALAASFVGVGITVAVRYGAFASPARAAREAPLAITPPRLAMPAPTATPPPQDTVLLSARGSELLRQDLARRGTAVDLQDAALYVAGLGFPDLERRELGELSNLFQSVIASRSTAEQTRIHQYVVHARTGAPLPDTEVEAGRALLASAVNETSPSAGDRLRERFDAAVEAGLRRRRAGEERTRLGAVMPLPVPAEAGAAPAETPTTTTDATTTIESRATETPSRLETTAPTASDRRGETYWRQLAQRTRARVQAAEARVAKAEAEANRGLYGEASQPCNIPDSVIRRGTAAIKAWKCEMTDNTRQADRIGSLESAKAELAAARRALDGLEDDARRAGALPGWLR